MKKQIKLMKLIVLALSLLFLLSACAGEKTPLDPKDPVSITLWHYYTGDTKIALETAVKNFNKSLGAESGVLVKPLAKGSLVELEKALSDSAKGLINAEPMPDLFSCYPDKALELDDLGKLIDLQTYFSEEDQELYVDDFLQACSFDSERLLNIPIVKSTELLYINASNWNQFVDETGFETDQLASWEGLYQGARAYYHWTDLKTPEEPWDGQSLVGIDSLANFIIIGNKQLGVEVSDAKEGAGVLNQAALQKIFNLYDRGMSFGYFNAIGKFRSDDVKSGELSAYLGSSSGAAYFPRWIEKNNQQCPIEFLALPYPVFEGGKACAISQGAGMSVSKSDPKREAGSAVFIKWFTNPDQNVPFAITSGYLPVQEEAYTGAFFKTALNDLSSGDEGEQNVAAVYAIAVKQINELDTYAPLSFEGSYDLRRILENSLTEMTLANRDQLAIYQQQGMTEEEILMTINEKGRFEEWLDRIHQDLDALKIPYRDE